MTNHELLPYEKMGIPPAKKTKKIRHLNLYDAIEFLLAFLLNKIYLFSLFSPVGLAYFAAVFPKRKNLIMIFVSALGILAGDMGLFSLKYIGALVICSSVYILFADELKEKKWVYGLCAAGSVYFTGQIYLFFNGLLLYDIMALLLESALVFVSFFALEQGVEVFRGIQNRKIFEPRETLSLLVICAGVILSLNSVPYLKGAGHVLSLLIIFIVGLTDGVPLSCCAGVLLGICNSITDVMPAQVVAVYAVSALCSGVLRKRGRWGVTLGFLGANLFSVLYFSGAIHHVVTYYYIAVATVVLFIIPDRFMNLFGEVFKAPTYTEDAAERLREIMADKLAATSGSFCELSDLFNEAVETQADAGIHNPGQVFDKTADCVCRDCSLIHYCWQKEYKETRHALLTLYNRMEARGRAEHKDVPERFQQSCIRLDRFLEELNKYYELHKINLMWAGRVSESKNLVAEQFKNISSVLENLKFELGIEPTEGIRLERKILAALDRRGICARHVRVTGADAYEVHLEMDACGGERVCYNQVAAILGHALGVPMLRMPGKCDENMCQLHFQEKARFTVETGFARISGEQGGCSGDNHMLSMAEHGKYILALSDGMGQGREADTQSSMTLQLIRRLLSSGFDKETALKLINSMLMMNMERETFATADLCLINLYSGALEFIKFGAASSYVKNGDVVEQIRSTSLPVGVVCNLEVDCDLKFAKTGDYVVMVTDGITDVLEMSGESRISTIMKKFTGNSPQQLADEILHLALIASEGEPKDDMTVLVCKIIEE